MRLGWLTLLFLLFTRPFRHFLSTCSGPSDDITNNLRTTAQVDDNPIHSTFCRGKLPEYTDNLAQSCTFRELVIYAPNEQVSFLPCTINKFGHLVPFLHGVTPVLQDTTLLPSGPRYAKFVARRIWVSAPLRRSVVGRSDKASSHRHCGYRGRTASHPTAPA